MRKHNWMETSGEAYIHGVEWLPDQRPIGIIQIAHGVTEYIERYEEFAEVMTTKGFIVCGNDHRGHGSSSDPSRTPMYLGDKGAWFEVAEDLYKVRCKMKVEYPKLPYILMGFSMGSFLVRTVLIKHPDMADAAIIAGTGQQSAIAIKLAKFLASQEEAKFGYAMTTKKIDELTFGAYNKKFAPNKTKFDWLCSDQTALDKYLVDSKRGDSMTVGLFSEMLEGMAFTANVENIKAMHKYMPVLFLSGAEDPVGEAGKGVKKAEAAFKKAGMMLVNSKLYPGCRHDIFHDYCKNEVYEDIYSWIKGNVNIA